MPCAGDWSPPHPRGSTLVRAWGRALVLVSPAPAGIDPCPDAGRGQAVCLPRTRGDRPSSVDQTTYSRSSPPHPRGSTRARRFAPACRVVSPAPAGIDPAARWAAPHPAGLPRTRGDRPRARRAGRPPRLSPPHPRGSTHALAEGFSAQLVSPAPAGIDPAIRIRFSRCRRLPRTRGDRPARSPSSISCARSPPHPRGSTLAIRRDADPRHVSPAPAGIDPSPARLRSARSSLPRTRGDRPLLAARPVGARESPPHPRGSTQICSSR